MSASWTPLELVRWTAQYFAQHGVPSPRLDAEVLLAHVLGLRRLDLYLQFDRPVQADERARFRELVRLRAAKRMPVAYLTGTREFWSRVFAVSPAVLIPRPETELLVTAALELPVRRVLELGVGSGAVAGTLAAERPDWQLVATDLSASALAVARGNLAGLGVLDRVALLRADALPALTARSFDAIVSNPPYVPSAELARLAPELQHEPASALDGGPDGLDVIRRMLQDAPRLLRPGGRLLLEFGSGQAPAVVELLRGAGAADVQLRRDLAGIERVVLARFGEAVLGEAGRATGAAEDAAPAAGVQPAPE